MVIKSYRITLLLLCIFLLNLTLVQGNDLAKNQEGYSAKEVVELMKNSLSLIKNIELRYKVYREDINGKGHIKSPDGLYQMCDFEWGWERKFGRKYVKGVWGHNSDKSKNAYVIYKTSHITYDGQEYRAADEDERTGKISKDQLWEHLYMRGPLHLVGQLLSFHNNRDLKDLLKYPKIVSQEGDTIVLEDKFIEGVDDSGERYQLKVWISKKHGYLPFQIKTFRMSTNSHILKDISVSEFKEVKKGIWVPIKGRTVQYYTSSDIKLPKDITRDEYLEMTIEEQKEFNRKIKYTAVKLAPDAVFHVDPESIKLNEKIDESQFRIKFSPGTYVDDQIHQKEFKIPLPGDNK